MSEPQQPSEGEASQASSEAPAAAPSAPAAAPPAPAPVVVARFGQGAVFTGIAAFASALLVHVLFYANTAATRDSDPGYAKAEGLFTALAMLCGVAAVYLGPRARREGEEEHGDVRLARVGTWLGGIALVLIASMPFVASFF